MIEIASKTSKSQTLVKPIFTNKFFKSNEKTISELKFEKKYEALSLISTLRVIWLMKLKSNFKKEFVFASLCQPVSQVIDFLAAYETISMSLLNIKEKKLLYLHLVEILSDGNLLNIAKNQFELKLDLIPTSILEKVEKEMK